MVRSDRLIKINESDNCAVALKDIQKGEKVRFEDLYITALDDIRTGHKIALKDISQGREVIKYGFPIGHAAKDISTGNHIHTHNIKTGLEGLLEYTYSPVSSQTALLIEHEGGLQMSDGGISQVPDMGNLQIACKGIPQMVDEYNPQVQNKAEGAMPSQFLGYVRENGGIGVRNDIWIINTVGCVNKTAEILARDANKRFTAGISGIFAFPHPYGCSQLGEDHILTQKVLAGLVMHPNAAGVLVLGLGCENNNIPEFKKVLGDYNPNRVKFLSTQEVEDEIEEGLKLLGELADYAGKFTRVACPVSKLVVGLKCGGSDAFSGITANPLVGAFSDMLIAQGGTGILTEVPEMFGAETILMNRCVNYEIFQKTVKLINDFKKYFMKYGQEIYENPSPGNKEGGISTLEEKSLGCTQKGGSGKVVDVLSYGERIATPGLNLLEGPGNDIVAATALTAAGAHIILFTTGRGTPLGAPVPTIKISTNSELYNKKKNWIDFNAGRLLEGQSFEEAKADLFDFVLKVASGEIKTRNEENGYREIAVMKDGVTL